MCLAIPSLVVTIDDLMATIDVCGARKQVSLMLMQDMPRIGDYVLVHAGFAIQKIEKERVESGEIMHESSIAISILDVAQSKCIGAGYNSIDVVRVRIGKAAGILPEALLFAFDAVKIDSIAKNAKLEIESVPIGGVCQDCKKTFFAAEGSQYVYACPFCGSKSFDITSGREMDIVDLEAH
jgi:hydrogenase nickel insertion protein HypA